MRHRNIIYILVLSYFPLFGLFCYFRALGQKEIGYVFFVLPLIGYLAVNGLKCMYSADISRFQGIFRWSNNIHALLLWLYLIVVIVGALVSYVSGGRNGEMAVAELLMLITIAGFWMLATRRFLFSNGGLASLLDAVSTSLMIYVFMNVVAAIFGIDNPGADAKYTHEFVAIFSPAGTRAMFPLAFSGQHFAIDAGILVLMSTWWYGKKTRIGKLMATVMVALGVFVLVAQSARAPVIGLTICCIYALIWKKLGKRPLIIVLLVLITIPVLVVYTDIGVHVANSLKGIGIDLSRSDGDVATLSNRDVIWRSAFHHMFSEANVTQLLLGYGGYGQVVSGISKTYSWLFENSYTKSDDINTHNTYIQILVDYGLLGVILFAGLIVTLVIRIYCIIGERGDVSEREKKVLLLGILYIAVCSVTEVAVTYYAIDLFSMFLLINIYVMARNASAYRLVEHAAQLAKRKSSTYVSGHVV